MNSGIFKYLRGDKIVWWVVFLLSLISVVSIYSSTGTLAYKYQQGNTEYYVIKHLFVLVLGLFIMFAAHQIKYTYYSNISKWLILIAIPLLLFTLRQGTNINDATRWITLPVINLTFQTSDLAKVALIMFTARTLAKREKDIQSRKTFLWLMIPVMITCGLILPANLSTAVMLFFASFVMMFVGHVSIRYLSGTIGAGIVLLILLLVVMFRVPEDKLPGRASTWKHRIENFSKGEEGDNYQAEQAKIAIASSNFIWGKGPGGSTQRNYLPHPYSDFIFAIIIEEYGLIFGVFVLLLYLVFLYRGIIIAQKCEGTFGSFLVIGLTFILVLQAFINMAVATNLFPVTGQTLPFLSMGGSSIWFTSFSVGIILSVSAAAEKQGAAIDVIALEENTDSDKIEVENDIEDENE